MRDIPDSREAPRGGGGIEGKRAAVAIALAIAALFAGLFWLESRLPEPGAGQMERAGAQRFCSHGDGLFTYLWHPEVGVGDERQAVRDSRYTGECPLPPGTCFEGEYPDCVPQATPPPDAAP